MKVNKKVKDKDEHEKLFDNPDNLHDWNFVIKYLDKQNIEYIKTKLIWKNQQLKRTETRKNMKSAYNSKKNTDFEHFIYIKFIKINGNNSYAIVCGETTSNLYKPLGDLRFIDDEKEKGLSKRIARKDGYEWDLERLIGIPTSGKYESRRLEGKILYDLNLMSS